MDIFTVSVRGIAMFPLHLDDILEDGGAEPAGDAGGGAQGGARVELQQPGPEVRGQHPGLGEARVHSVRGPGGGRERHQGHRGDREQGNQVRPRHRSSPCHVQVIHSFHVVNDGPWQADSVNVHIDWPYQVRKKL